MQFPRLQDTFLRFPLSILSAATATGCAFWLSTHPYVEWAPIGVWFQASFIGILLFTGLALLAERERLRSLLIQLLGAPILYLLLQHVDPNQDVLTLRLPLLFLGSLALIFAGPYLRSKDDRGFWAFSIQVWMRALVAIATSVIVVLALTLALMSIQQLFEVEIGARWSEYIGAIFIIFVPTLVFLSGIPEDYKALQKEPLKISFRTFATVLSLPLLAVYFVILATYVVKIVVTQVWPSGFVAMPIVVFSVIGFGTYALIFPLLQDAGNRLLRVMSRVLLWALPVFLVVYFVALGQRIGQYGVTEMRYLGVALGVLLLGWSLYFNFARKPWLKVIPATLFVGTFLISFGPWGMFQVSERSQAGRPPEVDTVENSVPLSYDFYPEKGDGVEAVSGFDYFIHYNSSQDAQTYALGNKDQVTLQLQESSTSLDITFKDTTLNVPLAGMMEALENGRTVDYNTLDGKNGVISVKIYLGNLSYQRGTNGVQGLYLSGDFLVKLR